MVKADQVVEEFLRQTLVGVISTIDKKGRPRTAPIWFHWENGSAYMFTDRSSLKWRNIQRNPYASLCVDWREPPYKSVILDGVIEEVDRSLYELVLMMALRYYGDEVRAMNLLRDTEIRRQMSLSSDWCLIGLQTLTTHSHDRII